MILIGNGINIIQKLTQWNKKRLEKQHIREQYKLIKYEICKAIKRGSYYFYFHYFLYTENRNKLEKKGFVVEPRGTDVDGIYDFWKISWEKKQYEY